MICPTAFKDTFFWGLLRSCVHATAPSAAEWQQPFPAWAVPHAHTYTTEGRTSPSNPGKTAVKIQNCLSHLQGTMENNFEQLMSETVAAEDARNFSKMIFSLCRSHAQQKADLQEGHPTDTVPMSAESSPRHKTPLPKATPGSHVQRELLPHHSPSCRGGSGPCSGEVLGKARSTAHGCEVTRDLLRPHRRQTRQQ